MRNRLSALVVFAFLSSSPSAFGAPDDDVLTVRALSAMTPAEIAKRIHADGKTWVARTIYIGTPDATDGGGITLYAMPEPASGRLCRVDVLGVATNKIDGTGDEVRYRLGSYPYVIGKTPDQMEFVAAEGLAGAPGRARLAAACHRTTVRSDITIRTGAKNLFLAPSTEIAVIADNTVVAMTGAVGESAGPLPFKLECISHSEHFCDDARAVLAKALEREIEYADTCTLEDACLALDESPDERGRCELGVWFHAKDMARIARVQIACDSEPWD